MITDQTRILILCTGNSCRSQMAEGLFRFHLLERGVDEAAAGVRSAGIETHGLNPKAVAAMAERGIDISHHQSTNLSEYLTDRFDYIITVCDNAAERCPSFPGGGERLHWPFDDPARAVGSEAEIAAQFALIRDRIEARIVEWLDRQMAGSGLTRP